MPTPEIAPTAPEDLDALGRFLADGFGTRPDAPFARAEVLRWKYFPEEAPPFPLSFVAKADGRIVGHVGAAPARFRDAASEIDVPALHMIDWLRDPAFPSLGVALMRKIHAQADVQFAVYGSAVARRVMRGSGYRPIQEIPLHRLVLRPFAHIRLQPGFKGWAKSMRDLLTVSSSQRIRTATDTFAFKDTECFDDRAATIQSRARFEGNPLFTARDPARLNHLLRCPAARMIGGWIVQGAETVGWAILGLLERDGIRFGKVVDAFLQTNDPEAWAGSVRILTDRLRAEGVEVIDAFHGAPWASEAFRRCGYRAIDRLDFLMRDREGRLPTGAPYHLTPIEADYAYL